jgi:hypothetical protein
LEDDEQGGLCLHLLIEKINHTKNQQLIKPRCKNPINKE